MEANAGVVDCNSSNRDSRAQPMDHSLAAELATGLFDICVDERSH